MGKGRILSYQGDGLYTIEILEDRTRAEAEKAKAESRIVEIDGRITELLTELSAAQGLVNAAANAQDLLIAAYQNDPTGENRKAMEDSVKKIVEVAEKRDAIVAVIRGLKVERLALQKRISLVDALPPLRQQQAWCADFSEELTGEVPTVEVPNEIGAVILRPGYSGGEVAGWPVELQGGAGWSGTRDGAIQPALSGTSASVFYNLAMLPGWQKWRPTFRIGTIDSIANDLCDVTLDPAVSSAQSLDVNSQLAYAGVPIYYMSCNGDAFQVGDRVVVGFSGNTSAPMVVGFESEPRICSAFGSIDVQTAMAEFYGAAALSPMNIDQGYDRNDRTTSLGSTYDCGGTTYTEVLYEHTLVPISNLVDFRKQEPFLYIGDAGNLAGYSATTPEFELSATATSQAMQIAISYDIARTVIHTTTGRGGKTAGEQWDNTCLPGYDNTRWFVVDTTFNATLSGQIEAAGVIVDWQRAAIEVLDYDSVSEFHSVTVSPYNWPIYSDFNADYSGSDTLTIGGVSVDLQAVSLHYGWLWYSLQGGFLTSLIPEIAVSVTPSSIKCAVSVARFEASKIVHYVIGFEKVDGVWQRADGSMIGSSISTRREAYEQATGGSYTEEFNYVPATVGVTI